MWGLWKSQRASAKHFEKAIKHTGAALEFTGEAVGDALIVGGNTITGAAIGAGAVIGGMQAVAPGLVVTPTPIAGTLASAGIFTLKLAAAVGAGYGFLSSYTEITKFFKDSSNAVCETVKAAGEVTIGTACLAKEGLLNDLLGYQDGFGVENNTSQFIEGDIVILGSTAAEPA